jgi:hypothetical protein
MRRLVAVTAAVLLVLAAPAAAAVQTETADAGAVHAVLTYDQHDGYPAYTGLHLTITNGGATVVDEAIPDSDGYSPGGFGDHPSVHAADLDGDGTVEVVLDLYTGGAHCCFDSWLYEGAAKTVQHWGDPGYRFKDLDGDGRPEFLSADDAFAGAFTSYAGSRLPLLVLDWRAGRLVDVTRAAYVRPRLRREAASLRRAYLRARRHRGLGAREHVRASLAAYAADQCSLRHCATGLRLIRGARRRHVVTAGFGRDVRAVLRAGGYLR